MSVLPPSVLPLVPSAFAIGDRIVHRACVVERVDVDRWQCAKCGPTEPKTDAMARDYFTDPACLDALGVPLFVPASVSADEPLPGRAVQRGENPFEEGRPYLMAGTAGGEFCALVEPGDGPWGLSQRAVALKLLRLLPFRHEMTITDTGTVWLRYGDCAVAYVPADGPTDDEAAAIVAYATQCAAFPYGVVTVAFELT